MYEKIDRCRIKRKVLYSSNQAGCRTQLICRVNLKTGYIGLYWAFAKVLNWKGGASTNPKCSTFLGVVVAEHVLSKVFKNVERMPQGNIGYDFVCGKGFKIDVKSSCCGVNRQNSWSFRIKQNKEADYFLCLSFDNRNDLNPKHIWLIPGIEVNHLVGASITKSTLDKWAQYELTDKLDSVVACCDILKD